MNFFQAIKTCFSKYASFKGRAIRSEFWYFYLFHALFHIMQLVLETVELLEQGTTSDLLSGIFVLLTFLPFFTVGVRRMHDVGRSAWWILISITGIGYFILLYWLIRKSDVGENKYGLPYSAIKDNNAP